MIDDLREFEIQITNQDYKNIVYFNTFKKEKRMGFIFACVAISLFLVIVSLSRGHIESYFTFAISVGVVLLFGIQVILCNVRIKKFLATNPSMLNVKRTISVNPEYISQSSIDGNDNIIYPFAGMAMAYELREYFLIFTKTGKTLIIPKRYMGEHIIEYTRSLLKGNLGSDFIIRKLS